MIIEMIGMTFAGASLGLCVISVDHNRYGLGVLFGGMFFVFLSLSLLSIGVKL